MIFNVGEPIKALSITSNNISNNKYKISKAVVIRFNQSYIIISINQYPISLLFKIQLHYLLYLV